MSIKMGVKQEGEVQLKDNKISSLQTPDDSNKPQVKPESNVPRKAPMSGLATKSPRRGKKIGCRQARRNENTKFLTSLLDDEQPLQEPDITDFISTHQSAFELLFLEQQNMEIWSEFMNRSGEEQDRFLAEVEEGMIRVAKKASLEQDKNGNSFVKVEAVPNTQEAVEVKDERIEHPAHTGKECFKRISTRLQAMLRRRHLPKGAVELHEEELLSWFQDDPGSVFISSLGSSFDRLLLHAVCQYLDLHSESYDCDGQRRTRVENQHESFHPPPMLLSSYLDTLR